jgi:TB2/DP1, HVA22 family
MLEQKAPNSEVLTRLTSWTIVCAAVALFHVVLDPVCGFWLPLYHPTKIIVIAVLAFPETGAAGYLFSMYVTPLFFATESMLTDFVTGWQAHQISARRRARRSTTWNSRPLPARARLLNVSDPPVMRTRALQAREGCSN